MSDGTNRSGVRYIQPLGPRVLVRLIKDEDRSSSGLYLPAGAKEAYQDSFYGEIIEVARATTQDPKDEKSFGTNVSGVPCGAHVLFKKDAGVRIPWDDTLLLLDTRDVLATVEEVEPDSIQ